jgi:ABC-type Mn2+/Zn2+ transport system ATPase subunit
MTTEYASKPNRADVAHWLWGIASEAARHDQAASLRSAGRLVAIVGPAGSGKTQLLLEIIARLWREFSLASRSRVAYVPPSVELYPFITVRDAVALYGARPARIPSARPLLPLEETLELAELLDVQHSAVGRLPATARRRVLIAAAVHTRVPLLLLDDADSGGAAGFTRAGCMADGALARVLPALLARECITILAAARDPDVLRCTAERQLMLGDAQRGDASRVAALARMNDAGISPRRAVDRSPASV